MVRSKLTESLCNSQDLWYFAFSGLFAHQKDRWSSFLEKVADTARGVFISGGAVTVDGLMLAKSHRLPAEVSLDAALDTVQ